MLSQEQLPQVLNNSIAVPKIIADPGVRINPNIMQFIMQCANVSQLIKLREAVRETAPIQATGIIERLNVSVTDSIHKIKPEKILIGVSIHNNGADSVRFYLNSTSTPAMTLSVGETINLNFGKKHVALIYLECDGGGTATVDVKGQF